MNINAIIVTLSRTPIYVWFILTYLLIVGFKATKPITIPFKLVAILPTVLIIWNGINISQNPLATWQIPFAGGAVIAGLIIGYSILSLTPLSIDKDKQQVCIPGTYSTLILFMSIFIIKYVFGFAKATKKVFFMPYLWLEVIAFIFIASIFMGRTVKLYVHFKKKLN